MANSATADYDASQARVNLDAEQRQNAAIIINVGQSLGASGRDIQIALMTAMQESSLHNVNYGDRDSLGLFQQRGPWGSVEQRMDPAQSARMFFLGGHGGQRGLLSISNREAMGMAQAAQAVQVSAYPDAYAKWQRMAEELFGGGAGTASEVVTTFNPTAQETATQALLDQQKRQQSYVNPNANPAGAVTGRGTPAEAMSAKESGIDALQAPDPTAQSAVNLRTLGGEGNSSEQDAAKALTLEPGSLPTLEHLGLGSDGVPTTLYSGPEGWRNRVLQAAQKLNGTPYLWGGASSLGTDCSGLVLQAFAAAGIDMPRLSWDQASRGAVTPIDQLKPGDLVGWHNSDSHPGANHIAIYAGNNQVWEAPRPGGHVQLVPIYDTGQAWGISMSGVSSAGQ